MDDLEFVQRCITGDRLAWQEFLDKYSQLIYRYIHDVLNSKGIHLAARANIDDIFQEVFVLLSENNFAKLKSYKALNGSSLASWLRQVVINYTIDYARRFRHLLSLDQELEEDLDFKDMFLDLSPSALEKLISGEAILHLTDCISVLDYEDKFFLELYLDRRISLGKITEALKISRAAVDMRKSRIIERMRDCFKMKGFG